jgi:hypothetical protein
MMVGVLLTRGALVISLTALIFNPPSFTVSYSENMAFLFFCLAIFNKTLFEMSDVRHFFLKSSGEPCEPDLEIRFVESLSKK